MEGKHKEMIAKFDKDGDGKLNEEERKAAHAAMEKEMLAKFDKDGDGKLSDEEKKAAREAMGGHRPPGGPRGPERKKGGE
jgi:Ca2+-binding EF-hand superfamily protein